MKDHLTCEIETQWGLGPPLPTWGFKAAFMTLTMRVFYLDAKKMKFSLSGWGLIFGSIFLVHVCFQGKFTRKMRKCKNKKKKTKQNKTKQKWYLRCVYMCTCSLFSFFFRPCVNPSGNLCVNNFIFHFDH